MTNNTTRREAFQTAMKSVRKQIAKRSNAITISVFLHLAVGTAIASFWVATVYVTPPEQETTIEFELVAEHTLSSSVKSADLLSAQSAQTNSSGGQAAKQAHAWNKTEAIMLSSLASLSELRTSIGFLTQSTADTVSGISPMLGSDPDIDLEALGAKYGSGLGVGGGNGVTVLVSGQGVCLAPPR